MKLLIIGHSVEDHIHTSEKVMVQPGGIYYTASALSAIKSKNDEIHLCTAVEPGNYDLFEPVYSVFEGKYIAKVSDIPKVHLIINTDKEREEYYSNISSSLNCIPEDINVYDGILINMITGYDISLDQLESLRNKYNGIIYMDVHTLSRGVTNVNNRIKREFRKIPEFKSWAECLDIIQVNQVELKSISDFDDEEKIVEYILTKDSQVLIVTKDKQGAACYMKKDNKIHKYDEPAIKIKENNKVGCGDVFGAVFFYTYIKNRSIAGSLKKANFVAGTAAAFHSLPDIQKLRVE